MKNNDKSCNIFEIKQECIIKSEISGQTQLIDPPQIQKSKLDNRQKSEAIAHQFLRNERDNRKKGAPLYQPV